MLHWIQEQEALEEAAQAEEEDTEEYRAKCVAAYLESQRRAKLGLGPDPNDCVECGANKSIARCDDCATTICIMCNQDRPSHDPDFGYFGLCSKCKQTACSKCTAQFPCCPHGNCDGTCVSYWGRAEAASEEAREEELLTARWVAELERRRAAEMEAQRSREQCKARSPVHFPDPPKDTEGPKVAYWDAATSSVKYK